MFDLFGKKNIDQKSKQKQKSEQKSKQKKSSGEPYNPIYYCGYVII